MALSLKPGVLFEDIHSRIIDALPIIDAICVKHGIPFVITAARDGVHKANSLHYVGRAIDIRTRDLPPLSRPEFHFDIQTALGSDYDVVLETKSPHVHVEFDPA